MRTLIAIAALVVSISAIAQSQVPNVFEDGTPASAAEVNENFQYVLENASGGGGCSVEQVDNTAEITCADGTTAVVPGYGTVVVYPEGLVGEVDPNSVNTGDIVAIDAMDVVLGEVLGTRDSAGTIEMAALPERNVPRIHIANIDARQSVFVGKWSDNFGKVYFSDENCQGQVILDSSFYVLCRPDTGACFAPDTDLYYVTLFAKSWIQSTHTFNGAVYNEDEECSDAENVVSNAYLGATYTIAPELLNAAYPVRIEQLP